MAEDADAVGLTPRAVEDGAMESLGNVAMGSPTSNQAVYPKPSQK